MGKLKQYVMIQHRY